MFAMGCELGDGTRQWSEDVAIADGEVVTIDRRVEFSTSGTFDAVSTEVSLSTLTLREPLAMVPQWSVPLLPLVLYRDPQTSELVVVASTTNCDVWRNRGRPNPLYWEFRLRGGWVETPVSASSFSRAANLLISYEGKLSAAHFTRAAKAHRNSDERIWPGYASIRTDAKSPCV
jgi:hypothetical protein